MDLHFIPRKDDFLVIKKPAFRNASTNQKSRKPNTSRETPKTTCSESEMQTPIPPTTAASNAA
jgi:hypothetical protein